MVVPYYEMVVLGDTRAYFFSSMKGIAPEEAIAVEICLLPASVITVSNAPLSRDGDKAGTLAFLTA